MEYFDAIMISNRPTYTLTLFDNNFYVIGVLYCDRVDPTHDNVKEKVNRVAAVRFRFALKHPNTGTRINSGSPLKQLLVSLYAACKGTKEGRHGGTDDVPPMLRVSRVTLKT